ncbi:MAG TPA: futalosine hydrolase [Bacteroidia bacterium]|nr:futalosine hydrolase [Bacteroidia bacterium]
MTDILYVVATEMEAVVPAGTGAVLVTGPGILATASGVTTALLQSKYRLVVNIGLCGSLDPALLPGTVVHVTTDRLADFGAESADRFLPADEIGLLKKDKYPFSNGILTPEPHPELSSLKRLPVRNGITVQKVHGTGQSCQEAFALFGPAVESMEGAAVFYCCMKLHVPCIQIRAVSNYVTERKKEEWKTKEALSALEAFMKLFTSEVPAASY